MLELNQKNALLTRSKTCWLQSGRLSAAACALAACLAAQSGAAHAEFSANKCTNGRALERRLITLRDQTGLPSISASIFTPEGIRSAAVGVRNTETGETVQVGDLYAVGSLTKTVTGLLIGSLVDDGLLTFDSTLGELLSDYANQFSSGLRSTTIGQLLNHTSGLPSLETPADSQALFGDPAFLESFSGSPTEQRAQFGAHLVGLDPLFTPGSQEQYSNAGYILAGIVAETVAGQSWETLIQDRIAVPLGIQLSNVSPLNVRSFQPVGHLVNDAGQFSPVTDRSGTTSGVPTVAYPAGGLVSSPEDWAILQQAQLRGLLGAETNLPVSNETLRTIYTSSSPQGTFGYGGATVEVDGQPVSFFTGSTGTFTAFNLLDEKDEVGAVVAVNAGAALGFYNTQEQAAIIRSIADLAPQELANRGLGAPASGDQASVYSALETLCQSDQGSASELVSLFGELPKMEARALAEAITPDDARIATRAALAPVEAVARLLLIHSTQRSNDDGVRYSVLHGNISDSVSFGASGGGADISGHNTVFAVDGALTDRLVIGGALAFGNSNGQLTSRTGQAEVKAITAAAQVHYGGPTGLFVDGLALYANETINTGRTIAAGTTNLGTSTANRDGRTYLLEASSGYRFDVTQNVSLSPLAGMRHESVLIDKATEGGSLASLQIDRQTYKASYIRMGFAAAGDWRVGDWKVTLATKALYTQEINQDASEVRARLLKDTDYVSFKPLPNASSWMEYDAGLTFRRGIYRFSLGLSATTGRDTDSSVSGHGEIGLLF